MITPNIDKQGKRACYAEPVICPACVLTVSTSMITPSNDKQAIEGVMLNQTYAQPVCSP